MLQLLTGRRTVPNVIVNFKSLGGSDEVNLLHQEGTLSRHIVTTSAGVLEGEVVDRELLERQVLERVLEGQAEDGGEDDKDDDGELESLE
jgi:hypothetical protein